MQKIIQSGAREKMSERELIETEIARWKNSPKRRAMLDGFRYYRGEHDILRRERTAIGSDGRAERLCNLPNHRIVDNQYAQMVNQKVNYLFGRPFLLQSEEKQYQKKLERVFREFRRTLHTLGEEALNGGICWLYPFMDGGGGLCFRVFPAYEVLPFWSDSAHTKLDMAVRLYEQEWYDGKTLRIMECVEVYKRQGVYLYTLEEGRLMPRYDHHRPYIRCPEGDGKAYNWGGIPLVPFRCNAAEIPFVCRVKSLQDGINEMLSDFENHMQEDARNTILVLKNYDGTNLAEFRRNLSAYGVVKVKTVDGAQGGVEALRVEVGGEQYKTVLELLRKALCRNAMGYDARDDRISGSPNQMSIQSMYSDIDLDANGIETEFSASFERLLRFVNQYLCGTGQGEYDTVPVKLILNRDMLINENEIMDMLYKGGLRLSNRTLVEQVPWVDDVEEEIIRLEAEGALL